jgi:hypothetical protein
VPKQFLVSLNLWCLWKHRNAGVFDGISPIVPRIILDIKNEASFWCMVGAKGLSSLGLGRVTAGVSNRFVIPAFRRLALVYFGL